MRALLSQAGSDHLVTTPRVHTPCPTTGRHIPNGRRFHLKGPRTRQPEHVPQHIGHRTAATHRFLVIIRPTVQQQRERMERTGRLTLRFRIIPRRLVFLIRIRDHTNFLFRLPKNGGIIRIHINISSTRRPRARNVRTHRSRFIVTTQVSRSNFFTSQITGSYTITLRQTCKRNFTSGHNVQNLVNKLRKFSPNT